MAEYKGVMIQGEVIGGQLSNMTTELLGCGRKLADDLGEELSIVILGSGIDGLAQEAIAFGADKAYVIDDPLLKDYRTEPYVSVIEKVVKRATPHTVLLGQTSVGSDVAPRLAFRLGSIATTDCIDLSIDPNSRRLRQTKPVYGGNAKAIFATKIDPQIATVRPKVMVPLARDTSRKGEVIRLKADLDPSAIRTKVLETVEAKDTDMKLEDAPVVISGGRGIGGPEGFEQLRELARLLKGTVGASRAACDNGWMPGTRQVGLTGKIIRPDIYLAAGISGAIHHMAGCSGARVIIAINNDPEANIFREAHYSVVGDWEKVLPAFTKKVKELLAQ